MRATPVLFAAMVVTTIAPWAMVAGQTDSTQNDSTRLAVATVAPVPTVATAPMPAEVRGYKITDTVRFENAAEGVQYEYSRNKNDVIHVYVSPYRASSRLDRVDDTLNMIGGDVSSFRDALDMAYRRGDLTQFRTLHQGEDDIRVAGHSVRGYSFFAGLQHRGGVTGPPSPLRRVRHDCRPAG